MSAIVMIIANHANTISKLASKLCYKVQTAMPDATRACTFAEAEHAADEALYAVPLTPSATRCQAW
eukprot:2905480-Prymnesium_polylepis.1